MYIRLIYASIYANGRYLITNNNKYRMNEKNNNDKGSDIAVTTNENGGADKRGDRKKVGSKQVDNRILVRETKGSEPQDTETNIQGSEKESGVVEETKLEPVPDPKEDIVIAQQTFEVEVGATINTGQYENIQPKIKGVGKTMEEAIENAMSYVKDLTAKYSINGSLKKNESGETVKLKSFNEEGVELDFNATTHTYMRGLVKFIGATTFIQRFYKKFDQTTVAKACSTAWEVPQKEIEDMWNSNGDLASRLGTLVDNALEHHNKFYDLGEKIKAKNGKDNPAMPKHPLLKGLIESFHALPHTEGQILHQVLITDSEQGFCGQADRLVITGEKKCRIQDFKVNIDSDKEDKNMKPLAPFNILPATKLTKYQLQMSFYANMLQKSGWTVEGLDAFVYENEWKIYPLDIIQVI